MRRLICTLLMAASMLFGLAAPSSADVGYFVDPSKEARSADNLTRVVVDNGTTYARVIVRAYVGTLHRGDRSYLWLSTARADPGPEFRMSVVTGVGYRLDQMGDGFWGPIGEVECNGLHARAVSGSTGVVRFSIPRNCLSNPSRVRAAVRHQHGTGSGALVDWAPAPERFFSAVVN